MLDEQLPTFYFRPSSDNIKHSATIYLSQYGADATPAYTLRHLDPSLPASKNRFAAALYDSYNPDILFGEVLLIPEWTDPKPTQEELRLSGGVPPAPQPILPNEFTIQLYNPDQQIHVKEHSSTWKSDAYWEFEMPVRTFRQPSTSALDRTQSDPTASEITPKINFKWKKDGKFSKDLQCSLSGKSTNADGTKRKHKEPDIPVGFFRSLKEVTVYEPNLSRVEIEDPKGFEVVLLLCAAVIKAVYFGQMKEVFNITEPPRQQAPTRRTSGNGIGIQTGILPSQQLAIHQPNTRQHARASSQPERPSLHVQTSNSKPPPTDPRSQWELDAETARLKKQVQKEEEERRRREQYETKRVKEMVEAEQKAHRKKQAEIGKETERLRREFANEQRRAQQSGRPYLPPRQELHPHHSAPIVQQQVQRPGPQYVQQPSSSQYPQAQRPGGAYLQAPMPNNPYLQPALRPGNAASSNYFGGQTLKPKKSSFFGLRSHSDDGGQKQLLSKRSSLF